MEPRLANFMFNAPTIEVDCYLSRYKYGDTPLRLAIKRSDLTIVKLLLNFAASCGQKIITEDIQQEAKELVSQKNKELCCLEVYALITTREKWTNKINAEPDLLFSKAIEDSLNKVHEAVQKNGVLFLGLTGAGKSTSINYFYGINYQIKLVNRIKQLKALSKEIVKTSHKTVSETLYPSVIQFPGQSYVAIEVPGFKDTRGSLEETTAALCTSLLIKQLKSIQALILVTTWRSLESSRMLDYRETAYHLGSVISQGSAIRENIVLLVTGAEQDVTVDNVRERLAELSEVEYCPQDDVNQEEVPADIWKKRCVQFVTTAILSGEKNILLADPTTEKTRTAFQKMIASLESKVKHSDQLNFTCYNSPIMRFKESLKKYIDYYFELLEPSEKLEENFQRVQNQIANQEIKINQLIVEIANLNSKLVMPNVNCLLEVNSLNAEIDQLQNRLATTQRTIKEHEKKLNEIQGSILKIESDFSETIYLEPRTIKSNSSLSKLMERLEEIQELSIKDKSRIEYQLAHPKVNISGSYETLKKALSTLVWEDLIASIRPTGWPPPQFPEFTLVISGFMPRRNTPENLAQSKQLRQMHTAAQQKLNEYRRLEWTVQDQYRGKLLQKEEIKSKIANAQALHEMRVNEWKQTIAQLENTLSTAKQQMCDLHAHSVQIEYEKHLSLLSLEVNLDLFYKILQIVCFINFEEEIFSRFISSIRNKYPRKEANYE